MASREKNLYCHFILSQVVGGGGSAYYLQWGLGTMYDGIISIDINGGSIKAAFKMSLLLLCGQKIFLKVPSNDQKIY